MGTDRSQWGYRIHEWGSVPTWEEFALTTPGDGEVRVAVEACGVGLTVLNCIDGHLDDDPALLPLVPGHEFVGRVVEAGPGVDAGLVGRRVVAYFYLACGWCSLCLAGQGSRCANLAGMVGVHTDGGYAPSAVLPAANAIPVPDDLDPVAATVVPDAVATPVHVCASRARVTPADRVAVIGAGGGVGAHMIQVAQVYGGRVVGLDRSDEKLELIASFGVQPVRSDDFSALDARSWWSEGPPTVIIDLIGTASSLGWSAESLAMGGRLVVLTTFPDRRLELDPRDMVFRELSVLASRYAGKAEVDLAARLVASGRVRPAIGQVVEPSDLLGLHDALRQETLMGRGALDWRKASTP